MLILTFRVLPPQTDSQIIITAREVFSLAVNEWYEFFPFFYLHCKKRLLIFSLLLVFRQLFNDVPCIINKSICKYINILCLCHSLPPLPIPPPPVPRSELRPTPRPYFSRIHLQHISLYILCHITVNFMCVAMLTAVPCLKHVIDVNISLYVKCVRVYQMTDRNRRS